MNVPLMGEQSRQYQAVHATFEHISSPRNYRGDIAAARTPFAARTCIANLGVAIENLSCHLGMSRDGEEIGVIERQHALTLSGCFIIAIRSSDQPRRGIGAVFNRSGNDFDGNEFDAPLLQTSKSIRADF
jgi:hypothetical protein